MLRRRLIATLAVMLATVSVGAVVYLVAFRVPTGKLVKDAEAALRAGKFEQARQIAVQILARNPRQDQALFLAGTSCAELDRLPESVAYFDRVSDQHRLAAEARYRAAEILILRMFQPTPAEARLRESLRLRPTHGAAQHHLAALLGLCGERQEAIQLRLSRIRQGNFTDVDLLVLALGDSIDDPAMRQQISHASPDDPLTWLMQATEAIQNRDHQSAERLLRKVLMQRPNQIAAVSKLGRLLLESGDESAFRVWLSELPSSADASSEVWLVRGNWASRQGDDGAALRCYAEAALRDPASLSANYQLSRSLTDLGRTADAAPYADRASSLHELAIAAKQYLSDGSELAVARLVELSRRSGLPWEAWGWHQIQMRLSSNSVQLPVVDRPAESELRGQIASTDLQKVTRELSDQRSAQPRTMGEVANATEAGTSAARIAFSDDAAATGLEFHYVPGDRPGQLGLRMFQFAGGGVAVVDFDQDGWPDLYFPQGHGWPETKEDSTASLESRDRLFRNLGNGYFSDATASATLTGRGYGQGATVGDFNSDGFPDVYVATLGRNRLYRNNGDGTFLDVSSESGTSDDRWTTSCLMADLNGDGFADIYAVNYLSAPDLTDRICRNQDGRPRRCSPFDFEAAQDQLFLNLGDGRFEDITDESGITVSGGKGLGIVAADFDGSGRLSLFVANDMMPNFYFANQTTTPGARPRFVESALTAGVAYDGEGRAQGCMGIAVGDTREDGFLDLFVSNYYLESNTLYEQRPDHSFDDATRGAGLREPSLRMLGFGTQFLDADLDGWSDLAVVNGHVDDETYRDVPFHMPPQFFRNTGNGRFVELSSDTLGPWFAGRYLGRGLARFDWNRDGMEDLVATNLDGPVALLTNRTTGGGRSLRLTLHGVNGNRDAIGAKVRVTSEGRDWVKQMTAGDGYESSNQRQLVFGMGSVSSTASVTVHWPNGATQQFETVPIGLRVVIIENRAELFVLPE